MLHTEYIHIYICMYIQRLSLSCAQTLVAQLVSTEEDMSLLITRFQEFLEMDDVRYYVMNSVPGNMYRVMTRNKKVSVVVFTLPVFLHIYSVLSIIQT